MQVIPLAAEASAAAEDEAAEASRSALVADDSQRRCHLTRTTETSFRRRSEA